MEDRGGESFFDRLTFNAEGVDKRKERREDLEVSEELAESLVGDADLAPRVELGDETVVILLDHRLLLMENTYNMRVPIKSRKFCSTSV